MNTEKQYIQAFNNGYILAQHEPAFLKIIAQNLSRLQFFICKVSLQGKNQLELEISKNQLLELQQLRFSTKQGKGF